MLRFVFLFICLMAIVPVTALYAQQAAPDAYRLVNLDHYIETQQPAMPGTKTILPPRNVRFHAVVKRHPERITVKYLYRALSMMQVEPLPAVNYRMFVETGQGKIIPLYVEDAVVAAIRKQVPVEQGSRFRGYHVYNYAQGPAIVISGLED